MNSLLRYMTHAFCFKDTDIDDREEGKILTIYFIPKKSSRMYVFAYVLVY